MPDDQGSDDVRPVRVARAITGLLRAMPVPDDADDAARADWFARKASLLDAVASAAACPSLAVEAHCLAREARATARTYLRDALMAGPALDVAAAGAASLDTTSTQEHLR
ncbi:hypothetical protein [Kineosporia sp. A_224]|uniref:hypothetical protein n=1 Tax=Kineosporia sp. A_224 TaxID=1962180 RepID=UPI00117AEA92|nr:hypothetical protein [Kineosporia sp. A_224]